ncbi:MAG: alanine racemase [Phenylobacterium sp.]|uniref:alanine racemase n=1 Tax=Phenylobacterium sp. TaxID=1871053 RepID=UPI00391DF145
MPDLLGPPVGFRPPMTPVLVVRRAALERNLAAMQGLCDAAGVKLRAHGKMHKCSTLGRRQVELGAVGLCCQTVGEAEAFAAAGIEDLLVTSPQAPWAAPRIAELARRGLRIAAVVDSRAQIVALSNAAVAAGATVGVLIDLDLGQHRTGVTPMEALDLARDAHQAGGLEYRGVQAYAGHLQHLSDLGARHGGWEAACDDLAGLVQTLTEAGLPPAVVTGGGTGTFAADLASGVFTELQAGSYAFMDVEYDDCGSPDGDPWPFEPALFLVASVVSANHKTHVTCDAGLKAHSVDGPPARVVAGAPARARWRPMGDEHGAIFHPATLGRLREAGGDPLKFAQAISDIDWDPKVDWPEDAPKPGDIVWLQPGHCDPTVNLHDALFVVDEAGGFEVWPIDARRSARQ